MDQKSFTKKSIFNNEKVQKQMGDEGQIGMRVQEKSYEWDWQARL